MNNIITTSHSYGFHPGVVIFIDHVGKSPSRWTRFCRWLIFHHCPYLWVRRGAKVSILTSVVNMSSFEVI